jgi:hypothetical protein
MESLVMKDRWAHKPPSGLVSIGGYVFFYFLLTFFINGTLPQLQIFLFNGNVKIPALDLKIILLFISLIVFFLCFNRKVHISKSLMLFWLFFVAYIFIEVVIFQYHKSIIPLSFVGSVLSVYFIFFILPIALFLSGILQENKMVKTFIFLFIVLAILGIAQFILNDPILPTMSNDSNFKVFSTDFSGSQRAFSLFDSGYSYGHFISFVGAIVIMLPINKLKKFLLIILVIFAGYTTLTRNTYLELATILFSAIVLKKKINNPIAPYMLSLLSVGVGFFILNIVPMIKQMFNGSAIMSTGTFDSRTISWNWVMNDWLKDDIITALFGTGLSQGYGYAYVDNMYLAIGAQFGIIGLLLFGLLFVSMTIYVFRIARVKQTPLSIAIAAFWTSFPIVSFFNISLPPYLLVFMILIISNPQIKRNPSYKGDNIFENVSTLSKL